VPLEKRGEETQTKEETPPEKMDREVQPDFPTKDVGV